MEYVHCVSRSIADSALFWILAVQDEELESILVDPISLTHHAKSWIYPPRIAYVRQFLWPSVETSLGSLSLTKPFSQKFLVERINIPRYFKRPNTTKNISCMWFCIRNTSKRTIEISTTENVICCLLLVYLIKSIQQLQARYSDIRKTSVHFSPLVSEKRTVRLLKSTDILNYLFNVDLSAISKGGTLCGHRSEVSELHSGYWLYVNHGPHCLRNLHRHSGISSAIWLSPPLFLPEEVAEGQQEMWATNTLRLL